MDILNFNESDDMWSRQIKKALYNSTFPKLNVNKISRSSLLSENFENDNHENSDRDSVWNTLRERNNKIEEELQNMRKTIKMCLELSNDALDLEESEVSMPRKIETHLKERDAIPKQEEVQRKQEQKNKINEELQNMKESLKMCLELKQQQIQKAIPKEVLPRQNKSLPQRHQAIQVQDGARSVQEKAAKAKFCSCCHDNREKESFSIKNIIKKKNESQEDIYEMARKLSTTLIELNSCEVCKSFPEELRETVGTLKSLLDFAHRKSSSQKIYSNGKLSVSKIENVKFSLHVSSSNFLQDELKFEDAKESLSSIKSLVSENSKSSKVSLQTKTFWKNVDCQCDFSIDVGIQKDLEKQTVNTPKIEFQERSTQKSKEVVREFLSNANLLFDKIINRDSAVGERDIKEKVKRGIKTEFEGKNAQQSKEKLQELFSDASVFFNKITSLDSIASIQKNINKSQSRRSNTDTKDRSKESVRNFPSDINSFFDKLTSQDSMPNISDFSENGHGNEILKNLTNSQLEFNIPFFLSSTSTVNSQTEDLESLKSINFKKSGGDFRRNSVKLEDERPEIKLPIKKSKQLLKKKYKRKLKNRQRSLKTLYVSHSGTGKSIVSDVESTHSEPKFRQKYEVKTKEKLCRQPLPKDAQLKTKEKHFLKREAKPKSKDLLEEKKSSKTVIVQSKFPDPPKTYRSCYQQTNKAHLKSPKIENNKKARSEELNSLNDHVSLKKIESGNRSLKFYVNVRPKIVHEEPQLKKKDDKSNSNCQVVENVSNGLSDSDFDDRYEVKFQKSVEYYSAENEEGKFKQLDSDFNSSKKKEKKLKNHVFTDEEETIQYSKNCEFFQTCLQKENIDEKNDGLSKIVFSGKTKKETKQKKSKKNNLNEEEVDLKETVLQALNKTNKNVISVLTRINKNVSQALENANLSIKNAMDAAALKGRTKTESLIKEIEQTKDEESCTEKILFEPSKEENVKSSGLPPLSTLIKLQKFNNDKFYRPYRKQKRLVLFNHMETILDVDESLLEKEPALKVKPTSQPDNLRLFDSVATISDVNESVLMEKSIFKIKTPREPDALMVNAKQIKNKKKTLKIFKNFQLKINVPGYVQNFVGAPCSAVLSKKPITKMRQKFCKEEKIPQVFQGQNLIRPPSAKPLPDAYHASLDTLNDVVSITQYEAPIPLPWREEKKINVTCLEEKRGMHVSQKEEQKEDYTWQEKKKKKKNRLWHREKNDVFKWQGEMQSCFTTKEQPAVDSKFDDGENRLEVSLETSSNLPVQLEPEMLEFKNLDFGAIFGENKIHRFNCDCFDCLCKKFKELNTVQFKNHSSSCCCIQCIENILRSRKENREMVSEEHFEEELGKFKIGAGDLKRSIKLLGELSQESIKNISKKTKAEREFFVNSRYSIHLTLTGLKVALSCLQAKTEETERVISQILKSKKKQNSRVFDNLLMEMLDEKVTDRNRHDAERRLLKSRSGPRVTRSQTSDSCSLRFPGKFASESSLASSLKDLDDVRKLRPPSRGKARDRLKTPRRNNNNSWKIVPSGQQDLEISLKNYPPKKLSKKESLPNYCTSWRLASFKSSLWPKTKKRKKREVFKKELTVVPENPVAQEVISMQSKEEKMTKEELDKQLDCIADNFFQAIEEIEQIKNLTKSKKPEEKGTFIGRRLNDLLQVAPFSKTEKAKRKCKSKSRENFVKPNRNFVKTKEDFERFKENFLKTKKTFHKSKQNIGESNENIEESEQDIKKLKQDIEESKQNIEEESKRDINKPLKDLIEPAQDFAEANKDFLKQSKRSLKQNPDFLKFYNANDSKNLPNRPCSCPSQKEPPVFIHPLKRSSTKPEIGDQLKIIASQLIEVKIKDKKFITHPYGGSSNKKLDKNSQPRKNQLKKTDSTSLVKFHQSWTDNGCAIRVPLRNSSKERSQIPTIKRLNPKPPRNPKLVTDPTKNIIKLIPNEDNVSDYPINSFIRKLYVSDLFD